jgi:hypothetical protein
MKPPCIIQGHHLNGCLCPFFVHPLCLLKVIIACFFCAALECHSVSEAMNNHVNEQKLTICEKVKIIQEVKTIPTTILWKASTTEEKS